MGKLATQGEMILAAGRFDPSEEMNIMSSSIGRGIGSIAYMTVHGKETDAYALFGCKHWNTLTAKQQSFILEKELYVLTMELPLKNKDENND